MRKRLHFRLKKLCQGYFLPVSSDDFQCFLQRTAALVGTGLCQYHRRLGTGQKPAGTQIVAKQILRTKEKLNKILSENTGQPYEKVAADTERDNWMSAEEALEYGLVDKIISNRM